jgi:hypothetical protein
MSRRPPDDVDEKVRDWMRRLGWQVTRAGFDGDTYAWTHEHRGRPTITLRVEQSVLHAYPAFAILELLDRLKVAAAMRACPDCRLVVVQRGTRVTLEEIPEPTES